ncbi:MAG: biotin transporter BioY [Pseudomonadota bacterium]
MDKRRWLGAVIFALLIALGARLSFALPGTDIPQSGQTMMVVLAGGVLGFNAASAAILLYLLAGSAGLPVFADGTSGAGVLFGPSGGYLLGFWLAAALIGVWRDSGWLQRTWWTALLAMLVGHLIILGVGAGLLSASIGLKAAWFNGVQPFLVGALVKSVLAAVLLPLVLRFGPWADGGLQYGQGTEQNR